MRKYLGIVILLAAAVYTVTTSEPAGAQANVGNNLTLGDVGENAIKLFPTGLALLTGGFALGGALLFLTGLARSNTVGQIRGANPLGGGHASWFSPTVSMVVGLLLMLSAAAIYITKNTFFGYDVQPTSIQGIRQLPQ